MSTMTDLLQGILSHDRTALAKAITIIESSAQRHRKSAHSLLTKILPHTGNSIRLAVTGPPGAGKSTLIDKLGLHLIETGNKVAVLAIDPSSSKSGGSILGDKTRMENLARSENAFIRPSPSLGTAGGVAGKTREAILLCEAAGFNIIIVETMGVGQGELAVYNMVDFFLLVQIAGGGDELQGMKKGIIELADAIVFNKADGDNIKNTEKAMQEIKMALHYVSSFSAEKLPVMACSAIENRGISEIWQTVTRYINTIKSNKQFAEKRAQQNKAWMHHLIKSRIEEMIFLEKNIQKKMQVLDQKVLKDEILPAQAAQQIIDIFKMRYGNK